MMRSIVFGLLLCFVASQAHAGALSPCQGSPLADLLVSKDDPGVFAVVKVNGKPETFLIDTGWTTAAIYTPTAHALRLPLVPGKSVQGMAPTGVITVRPVVVATITFAHTTFKAINMQESDISRLATQGILGAPIISRFDWDFDMPHGHVRVYPLGDCKLPNKDKTVAHDILDEKAFVHLPVELDGQAMTAFLDSGANQGVFSIDAIAKYGLDKTSKIVEEPTPPTASGLDGQKVLGVTRQFQSLVFLGHTIDHPTPPGIKIDPAYFPDALTIGMRTFQSMRIIVSYGNKSVQIP